MLHPFSTDEGNGRVGETYLDPTEIVQFTDGRYGRPGCARLRDGRYVELYSTGPEIRHLQEAATRQTEHADLWRSVARRATTTDGTQMGDMGLGAFVRGMARAAERGGTNGA